MQRSFQSKAIVLGGTRGLGRAIGIELLARGIQPIVVGRSAERVQEADAELRGAEFVTADLTDPSRAEHIVRAAVANPLPLSAFYWVAGEYHRGAVADQSAAKVLHMAQTHLLGPWAALAEWHRVAKAAPERVPYHLVVIGSVFVHKPGKKHAVLAACKAAKANFARVFAEELAEDLPGSMTLLVHPWAIRTGFFEGYPMNPKMIAGFMDPAEVARIIGHHEADLPREQKPPIVELTLDRGADGSIVQLLGPQPVQY
ncbi:SDR family oxidoreductase [Candidatus Uhrbacteria bacterium]|nr:SDR family oxidoreductase [Candidatus Uhrbacteria bacterium]